MNLLINGIKTREIKPLAGNAWVSRQSVERSTSSGSPSPLLPHNVLFTWTCLNTTQLQGDPALV